MPTFSTSLVDNPANSNPTPLNQNPKPAAFRATGSRRNGLVQLSSCVYSMHFLFCFVSDCIDFSQPSCICPCCKRKTYALFISFPPLGNRKRRVRRTNLHLRPLALLLDICDLRFDSFTTSPFHISLYPLYFTHRTRIGG